MKGGNLYRLRGKKLSATITALVGTTILLWAWEKTPLVTTLLSAQDQFLMSSSDVAMFASDPLESINKKGHIIKDSSDAVLVEETRNEPIDQDIAAIASDLLESTNKKENIIKDTSDSGLVEETRNKPIEKDIAMVASDPLESMNKKEHIIQDSSDAVFVEETRNKPIEQGFDLAPISFSSVSSQKGEDYMDFTESSSKNKACNYAKGKWVADSWRPLYSGFGCKQWLSEMWACRLTQRTDFSYEGYRWKPKNCNMPEFERLKFLKMMQDKTIAFVGDSLGRQQFQSLMCMATGGEDTPEVENIGWKYGLVKARGAIRPDGWAYRFPSTNTTILYYWSATLCDLEALNITNSATDYAMHLDRPAAFLSRYLHRFDVLVLNTGHHWNRGKLTANRWVMHINGTTNIDRKLAEIGNAKNFTVYSVAKWLDSQLPQHPRLKAFFRTISPRHFFNGDWNTGGSCDNTIPLAGGSEVTQDESSDPVVESALKGTKIKILDITALSQLRDEGHISRYSLRPKEGMQDCLHWCLPGIPDTWNELLFAQL